jgi:hypothetical protein
VAVLPYQNRDDANREQSLRRRLFGPSREEVWSRLAERIGGGRVIDEGFWRGGKKFEVEVEEWTVTLDTYAVSTGKTTAVFTRMRAPYVNRDGFRFRVYRKHIFTWLGKILGQQDVEIGDASFDENFVVQGNHEAKVRRLLRNGRIRELIDAQPGICFEVKDDEGWFGRKFPEGVDELHFVTGGVITDVERLRLLYELFAETLNELCRMGSAYEDEPGVG